MYPSHLEPVNWTQSKKDVYARRLLLDTLKHLDGAVLSLIDFDGQTYQMGNKNTDLHAELIVYNPAFYRKILMGGSIGAAEAYVDGWWDSPDLTKLVRVFCRNQSALDKIENKIGWLMSLKTRFEHWRRRNNKQIAKKNIAEHYDIGNELYRLFLDENMLYSSGLFLNNNDTLEKAQEQKMERLCQQLQLKPTDHLLEIGTGWGALAIYAAKHYGCNITTTTISEQQYEWAKSRIVAEGLNDQIHLLKQDYRDVEGQYDKIVSVEMIEAVGKAFLPTYIEKCQSLLKPNGLLAIQAITIADQRFDYYSKNVDFIQKHIFPGGFLPSVHALVAAFTQHSDFVVRDLKDMGVDYAQTLKEWRQRFEKNKQAIEALGYDDKFIRLWHYYFCYCQGGFVERSISTIQLILSRPDWR